MKQFIRKFSTVSILSLFLLSQTALAAPVQKSDSPSTKKTVILSDAGTTLSAAEKSEIATDNVKYKRQLGSKKIKKEIKTERKSNEKHFQLEDGTYMAVISSEELHYKDSKGNLSDIDPTITATKSKKATTTAVGNVSDFKVDKLPFHLAIPSDIQEGYAIDSGTNELKLIPALSHSSVGKLDQESKNKVVYTNVWDHTDVQLESGAEGIKENVILKSSDAPTTFRYEVVGQLSKDLEGQNVKLMPVWLKDASGETREVKQTLITEGNRKYLVRQANTTSMTYPISINAAGFWTSDLLSYDDGSMIYDIGIAKGITVQSSIIYISAGWGLVNVHVYTPSRSIDASIPQITEGTEYYVQGGVNSFSLPTDNLLYMDATGFASLIISYTYELNENTLAIVSPSVGEVVSGAYDMKFKLPQGITINSYIKVFLSLDNGNTWPKIIYSGLPIIGSTLTDITVHVDLSQFSFTTQARIKVDLGGSGMAVSDPFTIKNPLTFISPSAGEVVGGKCDIKFKLLRGNASSSENKDMEVSLSLDNGNTWEPRLLYLGKPTEGSNPMEISIPVDISYISFTTKARIQVRFLADNSSMVSDPFTISNPLTIIFPSVGEVVSGEYDMKFKLPTENSSTSENRNIIVSLSMDNGSTWPEIIYYGQPEIGSDPTNLSIHVDLSRFNLSTEARIKVDVLADNSSTISNPFTIKNPIVKPTGKVIQTYHYDENGNLTEIIYQNA
ncbi:hypothetical protein ACFOLF_07705 [Paenibacillus sepulcri]|uniref:Uncharacterized protein n=1 Tax=Paenibacillus sepulcri TaxID=359917 RepID=A0ABS7BXM0_9BACL|nr:hypothetical protein [Paenibacillus sepulcri]